MKGVKIVMMNNELGSLKIKGWSDIVDAVRNIIEGDKRVTFDEILVKLPLKLLARWWPRYSGIQEGILLLDYLERGFTINIQRYCEVLEKAIQNKRREKLRRKIVLFHDNAHSHSAKDTQQLLQSCPWEVFASDFAPSDYHHLFPQLNQHIIGMHFEHEGVFKAEVNNWPQMTGHWSEDGLKEPAHRYQKSEKGA